ncbi:MAG TPA: phosphoribosylanthranilate isomerase [Steroidobacteraceae bacterium]|nr:phosphoribosylanthranilate isomerase [Steroidobacteraceae bacterium]HRX88048.1 phosphoribosylanthranilate isomerase [Steroidobacteraceae bacterium]
MNEPRALWIKICGMTDAAAVDAALQLGVDAIGFVFAPSSRRLTTQRARTLAEPARGKLRCVAVTRQPTQPEVTEIIEGFAPDVLQTDAVDLLTLTLPAALAVMPVLRAGLPLPTTLPQRALFEGPSSGTGQTTDWDSAARLAYSTEIVLAGGLNATNVAAAIRHVRPFGVDVSSGVEQSPGTKSPAKMRAFVAAARQAAAETV